MQKGLTEVKIFLKVLGVGATFWNTLYTQEYMTSHSKGQTVYSVKSSVIIQTPKK